MCFYASTSPCGTGIANKYDGIIGRNSSLPLIGLAPKLNSELAQLFLLDFRRRAAHRIHPGLVLREGDHVTEVRLARKHHHHPVDPERDAAVRGRPHRERVEQEPELRPLLLV